MASRRLYTEKGTSPGSPSVPPPSKVSDVTPAVPTGIILKLLAFSFAMIVSPIAFYFITINSVFRGNATFAGAGAAIVANIVLIAYIVVAWKDDQAEREEDQRKEKKAQ
ncbi:hypothetical protein V8E54_007883 [Elaphomyces granulatus]|jgi:hypothetical protein